MEKDNKIRFFSHMEWEKINTPNKNKTAQTENRFEITRREEVGWEGEMGKRGSQCVINGY